MVDVGSISEEEYDDLVDDLILDTKQLLDFSRYGSGDKSQVKMALEDALDRVKEHPDRFDLD